MGNLAIIPARGGSKRIPKKNIKLFCGRPIIEYSINSAIKSGLFDEIVVSTDSEEISKIAIDCGAKVPFKRSAKNSDDYATTADVIQEVLDWYEKEKYDFDSICCIYPTSPLMSNGRIMQAYTKMVDEKRDSVFPVAKFAYPIQRALRLDNKEKINFVWPENAVSRSQDFEEFYHDAGQFYWINVSSFRREAALISGNSSCVLLDELEVQDIDNISDWKIAELKYEALQTTK